MKVHGRITRNKKETPIFKKISLELDVSVTVVDEIICICFAVSTALKIRRVDYMAAIRDS